MIAIVIIAIVALILFHMPFARSALGIGLGIYGVLLSRYPKAWLVVIPAVFPVLDLTPWSGWFFLDEFDLLLLTTVAVSLWRGTTPEAGSRLPVILKIAIGALALSYVASLCLGLFPLEPMDANAFANYFSRYNSLRVAKGFFASLLLLFLMQTAGGDYKRLINLGMVLGLMALGIAVLYERFIFAGVFNFNADLRAIATFSGLHNGGNDIEAYLAFAAPFIVAWVFDHRRPSRYFLGALIFALTSYSLLVTFSRGGYLGFLVAWLTLVICLLVMSAAHGFALPPLKKAPAFALFLVLLGAGVALPILKGDFIRARFNTVALDWQSRLDQLHNTFQMMDADGVTALFGMGLGRFPATYLAKQPPKMSPTVYTFESELHNTFLRIKAGNSLYFGERISVDPEQLYQLSLDLRGVNSKADLRVPICEKQLQKSYRCEWLQFQSSGIGTWEHFEKRLYMGELGSNVGRLTGWLSRRPVELALYNPRAGNVLDVDNIQLIDEAGRDLIVNGDFSRGHDRWFFTVDDLMPWQSSNHWGQIFFEQGWFGLATFDLFIVCVFFSLFLRVRRGDLFAGIVLSAIVGFLTVGLFGSLFDTPKMATLFYFGCFLPLLRGPEVVTRYEESVVVAENFKSYPPRRNRIRP